MIDESSSLAPFAMDVFPTRAAFVVVAVAEAVAESVDYAEPFAAVVACFHLILTAELGSNYQRN